MAKFWTVSINDDQYYDHIFIQKFLIVYLFKCKTNLTVKCQLLNDAKFAISLNTKFNKCLITCCPAQFSTCIKAQYINWIQGREILRFCPGNSLNMSTADGKIWWQKYSKHTSKILDGYLLHTYILSLFNWGIGICMWILYIKNTKTDILA